MDVCLNQVTSFLREDAVRDDILSSNIKFELGTNIARHKTPILGRVTVTSIY